MDDDGHFTVVHRVKELIKTDCENVASRDFEETIYRLVSVSEVVVVDLPKTCWIEAVTAFIVVKPGQTLNEAEVIGHCKQAMAPYKTPKRVVFIDRLPRNLSGTLLKRDLLQTFLKAN